MTERIKQLIEALGISNKDFAAQIGMSAATLSHITSGRNKPSLELITNILNKFDYINSDWLLFGRGEMQNKQHKDITEISTNKIVEKIVYRDQPKPVDHITVFYDDNTYCTFFKKQS